MKDIHAKDACEYVSKRIFNAKLQIGFNPELFLRAAANDEDEDVLFQMQQLLFNFIGRVFVGHGDPQERADSKFRKWIEIVEIPTIINLLSYFGFAPKPEIFDIEKSSRDCLIALGFIMWRTDIFSLLYKPLLPENRTYLPPYRANLQEFEMPSKDFFIPGTIDRILERIQRQVTRIPKKLHMLSDIELDCDNYRALIQQIDNKSTLYELSLKSDTKLLIEHIKALQEANKNQDKIQQIAMYETKFYKWLSQQVEKKMNELEQEQQTKSCDYEFDFFPSMTYFPETRMNTNADNIQKRMERIDKLMTSLSEKKINKIKITQDEKKQIDQRVQSLFSSLSRLEHIEYQEQKEKEKSIIPDMPFDLFSDKRFKTIAAICDSKSSEMEEEVIRDLEETVDRYCRKFNLDFKGLQSKEGIEASFQFTPKPSPLQPFK